MRARISPLRRAIEDAAKKAIIDNDFVMADPNHPDFVDRGLEQMSACKWVIGHIFSLPLASRMTEEEKERVRKEYANTYPNDIDKGVTNMAIEGVLERIFGKELFKND